MTESLADIAERLTTEFEGRLSPDVVTAVGGCQPWFAGAAGGRVAMPHTRAGLLIGGLAPQGDAQRPGLQGGPAHSSGRAATRPGRLCPASRRAISISAASERAAEVVPIRSRSMTPRSGSCAARAGW